MENIEQKQELSETNPVQLFAANAQQLKTAKQNSITFFEAKMAVAL